MRSGPSPSEQLCCGIATAPNECAIRLTWFTWAGFFAAVCLVFFCKETGLPVNHAYARGAQCWFERTDLYGVEGGFIYLPQSAIVYTPFYLLNGAGEQIAWRLVTVGLFALGVFRLSQLAGAGNQVEFFPLVTLLVLPKTWTCAYSGQATLAMAGLSMLALGAVVRRNWWTAAAFLIAALAFKPLAAVLLLLASALYAPLRGRVVLGLILFAAAPYATQDMAYVNQQYVAAVSMMDQAAKVGLAPEWAQLFSLSHLAGWPVPAGWQPMLRVAAAAGVWILCRQVCDQTAAGDELRNESSREPGWLTILSLATTYLLLFNPRTENNTYVLLAPVLAIQCVRAWLVEQRRFRAALVLAAAIAVVGGHEFCCWLTPEAGFIWVCPLVCLLVAIDCALGASVAARRAATSRSDTPSIAAPIYCPTPAAR
ncbi:MAG: hypothetical protein HY290_20935 [Planctomycetia bacterium]|nr:hypothetical protein [Planctomycetia bacterium]